MSDNKVVKHIIRHTDNIRSALIKLDALSIDAILFVVNDSNQLIGSLTDGDIRRGFIKGLDLQDEIGCFMHKTPICLLQNAFTLKDLDNYRKFKIIPIINQNKEIVDIINFRLQQTILPIDVVIMAGGKGQRLMPLTANTPKPLLKVGEKPIVEYNIDRLVKVGVKNITLSVNYLAEQIISYFNDGAEKGITIDYIKEGKPLGTIGSILLKNQFNHDDILVMNSDLLTNIDFADFYKFFKESSSDITVASVGYDVKVPYGVLEIDEKYNVNSLKEKPTYTYFSNAGIYLIRRDVLRLIPPDTFFDITDLMQKVMEMKRKLTTFPINAYWLDIGKHDDFIKAQEDIKHIKL